MDSFNINILPEENSVNITQGEPVNISVSQEVVQIAKIDESVNLEFLGDVTKIDANYPEALAAAQKAKQWAIGEPVEPAEGSAKYWAGRVGGLISRVDAIESKIPSAASSSNQLADKDWVESQEYITGITSSDVTTALGYTPYNSSNPAGYTSNLGTVTSVNNTLPDGSGNVDIDALPSQTGQAGKFLTTDGTDASWADVDALPSQTGHSGAVLTTDGTDASWVDTDTIYPVVETYVNGTDWYRVYSDGWVEQGGQLSSLGTTAVTVTLLKPFADTNYTITSCGHVNSTTGQYGYVRDAPTTTTIKFKGTGTVDKFYWMACGYGA